MTVNYLDDTVLDDGLAYLVAHATHMRLCSQLPATYAQASTTYVLGSKAAPTIGAPAARTGGGRAVTVSGISDGTVTANGTASHWALVDATGSKLLAAGAMGASQAVTTADDWTLAEFKIGLPAPA